MEPYRQKPVDLVDEDALILVLEPLLRFLLGDAVGIANVCLARAALRNAHTSSALHHNIKIHAINASGWVVLET